MASNKAPKNDFAPAWLKIPDTEGSNSSGGRSSELDKSSRTGRREDYYNNYGRYPSAPDYNYHPLQRQRSFDYYDERRYSPQKFRHHSVDDGYYNGGYGPFPYYNGYEYEKYGNHYSSQPSLYRDGKYQHPNARYGNGQVPVNGVFPTYYDHPYYEYYGEPYYGNYSLRPGSGGKRHSDKHNNKTASDKEQKDGGSPKGEMGSHKGSIEEEFPSLNGDAEPKAQTDKAKVNSHGVWEKPMSNKKTKSNSPKLKLSDGQPREPPPSKQSMAMYKSLVPNKASLNRKSGKDGMKSNGSKDLSNGPSKVVAGHFKSGKEAVNKTFPGREVSSPALSAPMEILNKQLVTQPKNLADKKSHFLKALKNDSPKTGNNKASNITQKSTASDAKSKIQEQEPEDKVVNGVHNLSVSPCDHLLSSSLEAEQRLLREMGWNEADDEEYVITEDDMKEFQNLSKQMKEKKNGLNRTLPTSWSPQHLAIYQPSIQDMNDKLSSTSDDSDLDAD